MPEISDTDLALLRRQAAAFAAVDQLWNDPKLGPVIKRAAKERFPEAPIPDLDLVEPVRAELTSKLDDALKQIKELRDGRQEDRDHAAITSKLDDAAQQFGLTNTGRDKLKKFMIDTQTPDPMVAAAALVRNEPALTGSSTSLGDDFDPLDFSKIEGESKEMFDDPIAWASKTLIGAMSPQRR